MTQRPTSSSPRLRRRRAVEWTLHATTLGLVLAAMPAHAAPAEPQERVLNSRSPALRSHTPVTLNFVNADVEAVSRAIGVMLERPIVVDPRVKGVITVYSEQPVTIREAYLNYLAALRGLGFTVVENGGLMKVVPEADAKLQTGTVSVGAAPAQRGDQIVTQVFRLNYESVNNLVAVLRPLISPNNTINANPGNNTLVITDYADNLQRLSRIIAALDTPGSTDVEVIPLKHAVAADVAVLVQRLADSSGTTGGATTPGAALGGTLSVLPDSRSNALIVRASNPARLGMVRAIVDKLDRESGGGATGNIYVVYLRNADAVKLATVLRSAFGSSAGGGSTGSSGSNSSNNAFSASANTNSLATSTAGGTASTQSTSPVSASAGPSTGGFVQADPSTNSLIITAPEPMYRQVRAVIDQLDSRRSQVYVEALIVEVNTSKGLDLGVQWQGIIGSKNSTNIIGLGTNFGSGLNNILGATQTLAQGTTGLAAADASTVSNGANFAIAHKVGNIFTLGVLAQALATNSGVNILSTPNLVTLDNEEAKIVVGSNVPFVTGQYTNTGTGTTSPFQTIERKDVGLTLRIRPQIGEGSTVRMTIFQESSAVLPTTAAGTSNAGPSTTKRSIESTVVVDDGQIIVLGGLIDDNYTIDRSKVPLLGDLPWIGGLFRSESRTRNKNNLMVFLRPVVMRSQESANQLTSDRYEWMRNLQAVDPSLLRGVQSASDVPQLPALPNGTAGQPLMGATPAPAVPPAPAPAP